jgi:aminotransferase
MREAYDERRRYVLHRLEEIGIPCFEPKGAFYVFPDVRKFGMTSDEFALRLLNEKKLVIVPGNAFGESGEGFMRISYAYSLEELKEALSRLEDFVKSLKK